jgi:energy-coupling factor transport system substrate-specific component
MLGITNYNDNDYQYYFERSYFMDKRLQTRDLINVGIFTAVYFVAFFATGMLGYIPVLFLLLPFLLPIVTGIPFMLYLTKVNKFGMVTITGFIVSVLMFATGHGWPVLVTGTICGLTADLVFKSGRYKSWGKTLTGFSVFTLWVIGALLPMWIMRDSYFAHMREGYGDAYTDTLMSLMSGWMLALIIAFAVIGSVAGAYLGRAALKKHFKRAGIA